VAAVEYASTPVEKSSGAWRALSVVVFLLLLLGAAIMILAASDISGTPTCDDVLSGLATPSDGECFDGSSTQKTLSVAFGFLAGGVGAIAALLAIAFTFTGRRGGLVVIGAIAAIVLAGVSIGVGSL
jgi:hypothetical protein